MQNKKTWAIWEKCPGGALLKGALFERSTVLNVIDIIIKDNTFCKPRPVLSCMCVHDNYSEGRIKENT